MNRKTRYQGIDVSEWQGKIDFEQVRNAGIRIVYIKATQGTDFVDPDFERNYRDARNAGLTVGFYHYVTARDEAEAREEAHYFATHIHGKNWRARPAMDFEVFGDLTTAETREISYEFLTTLERETGHIPALYSDASNASTRFADDRFRRYPLWIADYGVSRPDMENPWHRYSGWQYTDQGRVRGISGYVDRDYFRRDILIGKKEHHCE